MENAKKFFDETIKTEEAKKLFEDYKKPETEEEIIEIYSDVAGKLGIELSKDEIKTYLSKKQASVEELDNSELEQLTGGKNAQCYDTFENAENCWWTDGCDNLINDYNNYICNWSSEGRCAMFDKMSDEPIRTPPRLG